MNIRELLEAGHAKLAADKAVKEETVRGHPRVGTVGCLTEDGEVYGTCHRKAFARSLGIEEDVGTHTRIMWNAGEANEDTWLKVLGAGTADLVLMRQEEVKAKIDGVPLELLGHPDMVLGIYDEEGSLDDDCGIPVKPVLGLELKGIFGASTAVLVALEGRPKNDNLIQAATYSHFLKIPFALCYTSASYVPVNFHDQKKYGVKSILPFYKIFYLEWRGGQLWYRDEDKEDWVETPVTGEGIENYYRLVAEMPKKKDLWNRPNANYLDGTPNKWGKDSECTFCPFKDACEEYDIDQDYDQWLSAITQPE